MTRPEFTEEEIAAIEAEMARLKVDDVLLQTLVTLINLGARKAGLAGQGRPVAAADGLCATFRRSEAGGGGAHARAGRTGSRTVIRATLGPRSVNAR